MHHVQIKICLSRIHFSWLHSLANADKPNRFPIESMIKALPFRLKAGLLLCVSQQKLMRPCEINL